MIKNKGIIIIFIFLIIGFGVKEVKALEGEKTVYLTFDDGPSLNNTSKIVEVLNKNNVKASFFVVGKNAERFPQVLEMLNKNNMDIYPHCNNHAYKELYSSKEFYFRDLIKCQNIINNITGKEVGCTFVRMPGGSDNEVSDRNVLMEIKEEFNKRGIDYVDWNVDSGDSTAIRVSSDRIKEKINSVGYKYKIEVLLMHDLENKQTTTEALESIISEYKVLGYKFKALSEMEPWEKEYLQNIRVINRK